MADHLDAPGLKSPHGDAQTDITDIYAFQKPGDASKSILIMNVNPLAPTLATSFDTTATYELLIDNDNDAVAEVAYRFTFANATGGGQTANVRRASGDNVATESTTGDAIFTNVPVALDGSMKVSTSGSYQFYAGLRSDPFFFDLMGFLAGFKFTGADFFADKNVYGIVLQVPNADLGPSPKIGVWGRTVMPAAGGVTQIDRMGRPAINTVFNHGDDKVTFNSIQPDQDRSLFLDKFVAVLTSFKHPTDEAIAIAQILLPDILTYDYSSSAGFLNGRKLTDDVIDIELALVSNKAVTTDMVGPHTDYLSDFPYLGNPHPVQVPLAAIPYEPRQRTANVPY